MNEHDERLSAYATDIVALDARIAELEAQVAELHVERDLLRLRVDDLSGERTIYRELLQAALVMLQRLTEIIRTQRRAQNNWTREHEATLSEELLAIDAWLDHQLRNTGATTT
jgi:hypothetical protein